MPRDRVTGGRHQHGKHASDGATAGPESHPDTSEPPSGSLTAQATVTRIARMEIFRRRNRVACHLMVIRLDYDRVAMLNRFRQFWTKVITPAASSS